MNFKRSYVLAGNEPLECSMCDERTDALCKLPLTDPRAPKDAWIGLCKSCVARLLDGFDSVAGKVP